MGRLREVGMQGQYKWRQMRELTLVRLNLSIFSAFKICFCVQKKVSDCFVTFYSR